VDSTDGVGARVWQLLSHSDLPDVLWITDRFGLFSGQDRVRIS